MLAQQFQLTELQASWSLTITILMLSLSLLVYGPVSDAIGRKTIMVVTMAGAVLTALALSQVENLQWIAGLTGFARILPWQFCPRLPLPIWAMSSLAKRWYGLLVFILVLIASAVSVVA